MPYHFNPHRHVRIWISKNRDTWLNSENQLRLVRMREKNKADDIYFIFDSALLSKKAIDEMNHFCSKHHITPKDIRINIIPACTTPEEQELIRLYEDEVLHLDQGGNLAVASDLLRWVKPIYELGSYSDFDTNIDTRKLAQAIQVGSPILLNIGSTFRQAVKVSETISFPSYEDLCLNNDIIAIVDPEKAKEEIVKLQRSIIVACTKETPFSEFTVKMNHDIVSMYGEEVLSVLIDTEEGGPQRATLSQLTAISNQGFVGRKLREEILRITANNQSFCDAFGYQDTVTLANFQRAKSELTTTNNSDDELVSSMREDFQTSLLKTSVMHTTGPCRIMMSLWPSFMVLPSICAGKIAPSSFQNYEELSSAFTSKNSLPLHSDPDALATYEKSEAGLRNDLSWLEVGIEAIRSREMKMDSAAATIQRTYRKHATKVREAHQNSVGPNAAKPSN